jgi:predicted aconitase with swiveling domain
MSKETETIVAVTLVPGQACASCLTLEEPLSFWGGFDAASGRIIDRWHPQHGLLLSGRIVVMTAGRGSSSGSSVLAEAIRLGTGPAGIVLLARDAIVTVGAMVARELYDRPCPVVLAPPAAWPRITVADGARILAEPGSAEIRLGG